MPTGLPDWTLPVGIVAQLIDKLAVDIVAQSIGNLKVDIAAQSITELKVNVTNAEINVRIKASDVTLPVSIESSSVTLNVNISSQSITLDINISSQSVGLAPEDIWSVYAGYNKLIIASGSIDPNTCLDTAAYTVPSGKKLYVYKIIATPSSDLNKFLVFIYEANSNTVYVYSFNDRVIDLSFNPPLKFSEGDDIRVHICNYGADTDTFAVTLFGWEK